METVPVGPRPVLRKVGGPLILYHLLILAGAYLVVWGLTVSSRTAQILGAMLIAVGVLTEVVILAWSARLVHRTSARFGLPGPSEVELTPPSGPEDWMCVRCGRGARGPTLTCPQCGGPVVKVTSSASRPVDQPDPLP